MASAQESAIVPSAGLPSLALCGALDARKPRLPRLRPNLNQRAQQIIAAHMPSGSLDTVSASTTSVPVLLQLDRTAPRTARTHDISHLRDGPMSLTPTIPPSLIQGSDHVYETSFFPRDSSSAYSDQDGLWHTKVFPSYAPSSRTDAIMLDAWITRSLERYAEVGAASGREDLAQAVEDLVPILSIGLHEIVRQVLHHCAERGVALEKIWRTYVELFDRVLREMQELMRVQKQKTSEVQRQLAATHRDLQELRKSHPEEMHRVISELEAAFTQRQQQAEDELLACEAENAALKQALKNHVKELDTWYPGFPTYQESYIKNHLPQQTQTSIKRAQTWRRHEADETAAAGEGETPPEVLFAEDFKRLLAVLAPEKRKFIGKELTFLTEGLTSGGTATEHSRQRRRGQPSVEEILPEDKEAIDRLQGEIRDQEERIRHLRDEVARLQGLQAQRAQSPREES